MLKWVESLSYRDFSSLVTPAERATQSRILFPLQVLKNISADRRASQQQSDN